MNTFNDEVCALLYCITRAKVQQHTQRTRVTLLFMLLPG